MGGLGVKDYSGRQPNKEQVDDIICAGDTKPGFSFVLDNFAELLDDTFLQNLTSTICQGKHKLKTKHTYFQHFHQMNIFELNLSTTMVVLLSR